VRNGIGCTQQSSTHRQTLPATRAHPREDTPGVSSEGSRPSNQDTRSVSGGENLQGSGKNERIEGIWRKVLSRQERPYMRKYNFRKVLVMRCRELVRIRKQSCNCKQKCTERAT
jgi:hypothetical protein